MKYKLSDIAEFNPRESINKGSVAKKVAMDKLQPFCRDIPEYEYSKFTCGTKFRNGDTIMARITPCLENGKTAKVNILEDGEVGFGSTEYIVFRAKENITDEDYLYYLVCSPLVRDPAIKSMVGSSGRQRVQTDVVQNLEIDVPDLDTQRRIGGLLKSLDNKIAVNNTINENLLQQAEAIYKAWFCDRFAEDESSPWPKTTIGDITSLVVRGITPKYNDDTDQLIINQKCIRNHMVDLTPARRHLPKAITEKWLIQGDLLINSTGEGTLGRAAQVWFVPNNLTVDSHVTIVRPKTAVLRNYIGLWGLTHEAEIESLHTGSTGQTELPRERVKAMELPLPDESALSRFNELITPMAQAIVKNQQENIRLAELRDTLLPRLMSGELDVSELDR